MRAVGIVAVVGGVAVLAAARTVADPDLWGHVRFGQLILAAGEILRSDPFSYLTAGHTWINHEWLSEAIFAASYRLLGPAGLVSLKALLVLVMVFVAYRHLCRKGLDVLRAGIVVVLLLALMLIGVPTVRPHIFTYLLFFAVLLALEAAERGRWRWLWALPPLFALWVNLHGGFLAGLGVLGAWAVTRVGVELWRRRRAAGETISPRGRTQPEASRRREEADRSPRAIGWPIAVLLASGAATLLNPYGVELLTFLARTATVPRPEITEWHPIEIASVPGLWYLLFLALLAAGLLRSDRRKRPGPMVVLAVSAVVPLLAVRHLPLFGLAGVAFGGEHLAGAFARRGSPGSAPGGSRPLRRTVAAVGTVAGLVLVGASLPRFGCIELGEDEYPVGAVRVLEESGAAGNLAVFFNWGEYAIWHLAPDLRVSMDGRRETVYPDTIYQEHLRFIWGTGAWDDLLDNRPTDVALVERGGPTFNLLSLKPGWTPVYSDSLAGIFAREGWRHADRVRRRAGARESDPGPVCFP